MDSWRTRLCSSSRGISPRPARVSSRRSWDRLVRRGSPPLPRPAPADQARPLKWLWEEESLTGTRWYHQVLLRGIWGSQSRCEEPTVLYLLIKGQTSWGLDRCTFPEALHDWDSLLKHNVCGAPGFNHLARLGVIRSKAWVIFELDGHFKGVKY